MINVKIERLSGDGQISSYRVQGHAGFADSGQDIVCAGVSVITIGTVNSVEELLKVYMKQKSKHGLLHVFVPQQLDDLVQEKVQLLLESMVVMLKSIEETYGQYIAIEEIIIKKGVQKP